MYTRLTTPMLVALTSALAACTTLPGGAPPVTIKADQPNVVSYWNEVANKTALATSAQNTTPEEQRPAVFFDLASVHVAIYDAVVAIEGRYKPFAVKPRSPAAGASTDAAASAAAHGVLKALFPNRSAEYLAAYAQRLAAIPDGPAKAAGLALGAEVAAEVVRLRANDGRMVALAPYVSGTAPGQFRAANPNPVFRHFPSIKPFALQSLGQFRPPPPPALDSASYATAVAQTRALGGSTSTQRTAEQLEVARFHTEPAPPAVTRNLGRFAASTANVADAARLMAALYVSYVDAIGACFEAKYHYQAWRPANAIAATDPAWTPALPTPNHPEYPAAHSCTSGSVGEALRQHYGTPQVTFTWDSKATGTTRTYTDIEAFKAESALARIHGGMHFSHATVAGEELGRKVAQWVGARHFGRLD
ncbi:MAG: hypothetical protein RL758_545 [Pseudomonadota bacterium]|jgi:hypothetical protein